MKNYWNNTKIKLNNDFTKMWWSFKSRAMWLELHYLKNFENKRGRFCAHCSANSCQNEVNFIILHHCSDWRSKCRTQTQQVAHKGAILWELWYLYISANQELTGQSKQYILANQELILSLGRLNHIEPPAQNSQLKAVGLTTGDTYVQSQLRRNFNLVG